MQMELISPVLCGKEQHVSPSREAEGKGVVLHSQVPAAQLGGSLGIGWVLGQVGNQRMGGDPGSAFTQSSPRIS